MYGTSWSLRSVAGRVMLPPDVLCQPLEYRGDVAATEGLEDLLHGLDVAHRVSFGWSRGPKPAT
jgi:hypothetical protein